MSAQDRWGVVIMTTPSSGGNQETICLPIRKLAGFLATINPAKVKEELRDRIIQYQNECDDVLYHYWSNGRADSKFKSMDNNKQETYNLDEQLRAVRVILETHNMSGDPLTLALDQYYRTKTGGSALRQSGVHILPADQQQLLTPTMIGQRVTPTRKASEVNQKLADLGMQEKRLLSDGKNTRWELTEKGRSQYGVLEYIGKRTGKGTPVQQVKWRESIIDVIQAAFAK